MRVNGQRDSKEFQQLLRILRGNTVTACCLSPIHSLLPSGPFVRSDKLTCIQEGCLCPRGTFLLWSAVCLLCPSDLLCNQSVCLQSACLLCLLLLVHEFHLVTAYISLNNYSYQLPPILPITHTWKEETIFGLLRLKLLYVTRGFSPFSLYLKKFSVPSLLPPQARTLFLPVYNLPMLFFFVFGSNRLYPLLLAVAGDQVTPP